MTKLNIALFKYFSHHKGIMYFLMIASFIIFGFIASKLIFEEDITKLLPSSDNNGNENIVFRNLRVKEIGRAHV